MINTTQPISYLQETVTAALLYTDTNGIDLPVDLRIRARRVGALKVGDDLPSINAQYHDAITDVLIGYLDGGSLAASRNAFRRAMVDAFGAAFDLGWVDGGGELPPSGAALAWFNARVNAEMGYIDLLFQQARELRGTEDFDMFAWITARADGYTSTLREIYNNAKLRAMKDRMVTFDGLDGVKDPCDTCQQLKGKRHKISWFVRHDFVPPHGGALDCSKGGKCQHFLRDDDGLRITI